MPAVQVFMLHAGALGDCVLTIHLAAALRRAGHAVTLAARSPIAGWAARRGLLDKALPLDRVAPLLRQSERGRAVKKQLSGSAPAPRWEW